MSNPPCFGMFGYTGTPGTHPRPVPVGTPGSQTPSWEQKLWVRGSVHEHNIRTRDNSHHQTQRTSHSRASPEKTRPDPPHPAPSPYHAPCPQHTQQANFDTNVMVGYT